MYLGVHQGVHRPPTQVVRREILTQLVLTGSFDCDVMFLNIDLHISCKLSCSLRYPESFQRK